MKKLIILFVFLFTVNLLSAQSFEYKIRIKYITSSHHAKEVIGILTDEFKSEPKFNEKTLMFEIYSEKNIEEKELCSIFSSYNLILMEYMKKEIKEKLKQ